MRRFTLCKAIVATVVVALVLAFGAVQFASYAFDARAAAAGTLPTRVPPRFGLIVYHALDAVAPAPYVEATLAQYALYNDDAASAEHYALRLPASPTRDELLARVARARGEPLLALEYFLAAPDVDAIDETADALAIRSPAAAYALERLLRVRLALLGTHPDAVADAYWRMGRFANRQAWREVSGSPKQLAWLRRGLRDFEAAVALAPLSERYIIAAANQADLMQDRTRAAALFRDAFGVDPASADAIAGMGVVAFERGDRAGALRLLEQARALDPNALMVRALERDLR